jgi:hypothetical protein
MKLIPYLAFAIETRDPPDVIARRLAETTDRPRWFRYPASKFLYIGKIGDGGFWVVPIIRYRNSFMPVIRGRIEPQQSGTTVHITMSVHWIVIIGMSLWCGGVVVGGVNMLIQALTVGEPIWGALFATSFFLLFAAGLTVWAFWSEVPQRRGEITQTLFGNAPGTPPGCNGSE